MYNAQRSEQHFLLARALLGVHGVQKGVLFPKSFFFLPSIISVRTIKSQYRYDINLPKNGTLAINCKVAVSKVACLTHHIGQEKQNDKLGSSQFNNSG